MARSPRSGRAYTVEAKGRQRPGITQSTPLSELQLGVGKLLKKALAKPAEHERIVFIDANLPTNGDIGQDTMPDWMREAIEELRAREPLMRMEDGQAAPPAYVFITNHPNHYALGDPAPGLAVIAEGFKIPDFKYDQRHASLAVALVNRERHRDMHDLVTSMRQHYVIPATFDGEPASLKFSEDRESPARLRIGDKYVVPDHDGVEQVGTLTSAWVMEPERKAYGSFRMDGEDSSVLAAVPLSDGEFEAYREHPSTFFGEVSNNRPGGLRDALDAFDWFFETYKHTPKERLLEFMRESSDFQELTVLSQEKLAFIYCERMATHLEAMRQGAAEPVG